MKLAFYKAFQNNATALDIAIAIASGGKYSHVELVFSNEESFSISPRDKVGRFKDIVFHPDRWDFIELNIEAGVELVIREEANKLLGLSYDYIGALTSVLPICIQENDKIFCSEAVANILRYSVKYSYLRDGCKYSPVNLHKEILQITML